MLLSSLLNLLLAGLFLYNIICLCFWYCSFWSFHLDAPDKHMKTSIKYFSWLITWTLANSYTYMKYYWFYIASCFQNRMLPLLTVGLHSSATYTMVWASHLLCNPSIRCPLQQPQYLLSFGSSEVLLQMKYTSTTKTLTSYCSIWELKG